MSDPDTYQIDYYNSRENVDQHVASAYDRYSESSQAFVKDVILQAYIAPESIPDEVYELDVIEEGYQLCANSLTFQNYGFNADYYQWGGSRSYLANEESAIFCTAVRPSKFFIEGDPNRNCPADLIPYDYPNWSPTWYTAACRPWFKAQAANPTRSIFSDLYVYAESPQFGLTICAPIIKRTETTSQLFAPFCLDVIAGGYLFTKSAFELNFSSAYLLFNEDAAFKQGPLEQSAFQKAFNELFVRRTMINNPGFSIEQARPIELITEYARLFDY